MTPPKPFGRSDAMAICTNHIAFLNFRLRLSNAFGERNVERFVASHMIKIKRSRMLFVSAISAARGHFVCVQPIADTVCAIVSQQVNALPIARICQSCQSQFFLPFRRNRFPSASRSGLAQRTANLCRPFGSKGLPANGAGEYLRRSVFPRRHNLWIARNQHACKPDIFAATYEAADGPSASLRITGPNSDAEYWLHIKANGRSSGINLGGAGSAFQKRILDDIVSVTNA